MQEMLTLAEKRGVVLWSERERVFVETSVTTDTWGNREGEKFIRCGVVANYCAR